MKKLFWILAISAFGLSGIAQETQADTARQFRYCSEPRGNGVYVTHEGKEIATDIHLEDGTIIHPDGLVETPDRFFTMRPNQCYRWDGRLKEESGEPSDIGSAGK